MVNQVRINERYAQFRETLEPVASRLGRLPLMGTVRRWSLSLERRVFGDGYEAVDTVHGFRVYVEKADHAVGRTLRATKAWQPDETAIIKKICREGDTCIDVGANIGYFSNLMAAVVGPKGLVIAFEPDPTNFGHLQRSVEYNQRTNLEALQLAAGEKEGEVTLFFDPVNHGNHSIVKADVHQDATTVKVVRLDDLIAERCPTGRIRLIKIDVQGYERQVIEGLGDRIDQVDSMLIEYYPKVSEDPGSTAFLDQLASIGDLWITKGGALKLASREDVLASVRDSPYAQIDLLVAKPTIEVDK